MSKRVLLAVMLAFSTHISHADSLTEGELPVVNEMIRELDYLIVLADQAERNRTRDVRFPLDYETLRRDIKAMRAALQNHVESPSRSPREIPELSLEY